MSNTMATGRAVLTMTMAACALWQARARAESAPPDEPATDPVAVELLEGHNRERAEADLPPLALNSKLTAAAIVHARDMARHGKMSHEGSDGSKPAQRIERQGYHYRRSAENVASGQRTVEEVMKGWMNSPHHRENILGDVSELGAARVEDEEGTPYWCTTFGLPWPRLDPARAAAALVEEINRRRAEAKLPSLKVEPTLAAAAQHQARVMAEQGNAVSEDDDGLTPFDRVKEAGGRFRAMSLSILLGEPDVPAAARALMDDSDQKPNVLGTFTHIGIGCAQAKDEVPYWCILYGRAAAR